MISGLLGNDDRAEEVFLVGEEPCRTVVASHASDVTLNKVEQTDPRPDCRRFWQDQLKPIETERNGECDRH